MEHKVEVALDRADVTRSAMWSCYAALVNGDGCAVDAGAVPGVEQAG